MSYRNVKEKLITWKCGEFAKHKQTNCCHLGIKKFDPFLSPHKTIIYKDYEWKAFDTDLENSDEEDKENMNNVLNEVTNYSM